MKAKILSLLAVTALMLSLCSCGGQLETNSNGNDGELGASPSGETDPSSSKTVNQPGSGTGTTSGKTEAISGQTNTAKQTGATTRALEVLKRGNSTWKEVPIKEGAREAFVSLLPFDLREFITEADYVFSGTVISRKEYEVSWTDKDGKTEEQTSSSIIEVEVDHEYYGRSPVKGNTIKVCYPDSLSTIINNSVLVKDQGEYVFVTRALDDKYVERRNNENPDDQVGEENYADVFLYGPIFSLLPIEKSSVISYYEYFNWNNDIMKKVKPNMETDKLSSGKTGGRYIVLDKKDFDVAFNQLFEKAETLPTAIGFFKRQSKNELQ